MGLKANCTLFISADKLYESTGCSDSTPKAARWRLDKADVDKFLAIACHATRAKTSSLLQLRRCVFLVMNQA